MKKQLTERQQEILTYILEYREFSGYPPTLREIGKQFNISSTFGVKRHLDALEKKGYVNIESNASRGISFTKGNEPVKQLEETAFYKIPVVGRVAAGSPITAIENIDGSIVVDPNFIKKAENCFALKVKGDSMINAGIFEDDLVIVQPQTEALNGETVVAMLYDEVTVKIFEKKHNSVRLLPENSKYMPIEVNNLKEFSIIGKVVGVVRWLN